MTTTLWQRLTSQTWQVLHLPDGSRCIGPDGPEQIMAWPEGERHHDKQGRSIGRFTLSGSTGKRAVYLKRQYRLPRWTGWLATVLPARHWSPALREFENLNVVRELGVPVPAAWAAGESIGPWGRLQSFLAVEELTGMLALHEAIPLAAQRLSARALRSWKNGLIAEIARLVRRMHDAGYYHQDLYLCHFFIAECDISRPPPSWVGRVALIDFHRLLRRRWLGVWQQIKDLAQLLFSADLPSITARDRLQFWRAYRGNAERGFVARLIAWKAGQYRRHNSKRSQPRAT